MWIGALSTILQVLEQRCTIDTGPLITVELSINKSSVNSIIGQSNSLEISGSPKGDKLPFIFLTKHKLVPATLNDDKRIPHEIYLI